MGVERTLLNILMMFLYEVVSGWVQYVLMFALRLHGAPCVSVAVGQTLVAAGLTVEHADNHVLIVLCSSSSESVVCVPALLLLKSPWRGHCWILLC